MKKLHEIFTDPSIGKVAQNFPFDATIMAYEWFIPIEGLYMDTMLVHHALYPEMPKSLDFLTSIYTEIPHYSDHDSGVDKEEWEYNCWDCIATWRVMEALEEEVDPQMWEFYKNHIEPTMYGLTRCQNRGVLIDLEQKEEMKGVVQEKRNELHVQLLGMV